MEEKEVAELIKDLIIKNCFDVEEITTIKNSPYATTVGEEGCYMVLPNGQRFLIYVKEN